ncbi:hypothetical protein IWQ61_010278 [Dispira simplex]|nr:hypothetical protein IWQ61_010278 [Dispira simplex]
MKIIGLTGGIATGKSTVSDVFKEANVPVVDADVIARQIVEPGQLAYRDIVKYFGPEIVNNSTGELDRAKLGAKVFGDEVLRERLNSLTHPRVRREMFKQVLSYYLRGEPIILLDVPLLFESRLDRFVTDTVVVYCPQDIQLGRLMRRNGFDGVAAQQRIGAQMPIAYKRDRANFVIDNSGDLEFTKTQVLRNLA